MAKKCTLCGGKLDSTKRCTFCGLDNTKNDELYQKYLNHNSHEKVPLTHVHNEPSMHNYEYKKQEKTKAYDYAKSVQSQTKSFAEQYASTVRKRNNVSNKKKKEKVRKPGKILGIIVVIMGVLPTLFGLLADFAYNIADEFDFSGIEEEYVFPDITYEEWLPAGFHEVGVHIPEGTYDVVLDWGDEGAVEVMECVDGVMYSNEYFFLESDIEDVIYNVSLLEGEILRVSPEIRVYLYSKDADPNTMYTELNDLNDHYSVGVDMMLAGIDFPAGVYDISYVASEEAEMGTVTISLWNNEYQTVMVVDNLYFDDSYGSALYCNVPFEEGSYIYVSGLENVELVPSLEVKSGYNFNMTPLDDSDTETL